MTEQPAYVVTIGEVPTHSALTLQPAQDAALAAETKYVDAADYSYRWDEYRTGQTWRLMQRHKDRKGRFAWTGRAVHAVEHITS